MIPSETTSDCFSAECIAVGNFLVNIISIIFVLTCKNIFSDRSKQLLQVTFPVLVLQFLILRQNLPPPNFHPLVLN